MKPICITLSGPTIATISPSTFTICIYGQSISQSPYSLCHKILIVARYNTPSGFGVGLFAFVPQLSALITVSLVFGRDLSFCVFILTMIFVTFNKVCTAQVYHILYLLRRLTNDCTQYFVWYTSLLPLVLPASTLTRKHYIGIIVAWFGAELNWLYWAYYLEMEGFNTFFQIWIAGLLFFMVNVGIILTFIRSHVFQPLFHKDKLIRHT